MLLFCLLTLLMFHLSFLMMRMLSISLSSWDNFLLKKVLPNFRLIRGVGLNWVMEDWRSFRLWDLSSSKMSSTQRKSWLKLKISSLLSSTSSRIMNWTTCFTMKWSKSWRLLSLRRKIVLSIRLCWGITLCWISSVKNGKRTVRSRLGILSISTEKDILLMWSISAWDYVSLVKPMKILKNWSMVTTFLFRSWIYIHIRKLYRKGSLQYKEVSGRIGEEGTKTRNPFPKRGKNGDIQDILTSHMTFLQKCPTPVYDPEPVPEDTSTETPDLVEELQRQLEENMNIKSGSDDDKASTKSEPSKKQSPKKHNGM